jgi:hypothetical protein
MPVSLASSERSFRVFAHQPYSSVFSTFIKKRLSVANIRVIELKLHLSVIRVKRLSTMGDERLSKE